MFLFNSSSWFGYVRIPNLSCKDNMQLFVTCRCYVMSLLLFPNILCQVAFIHLYLIFARTDMVIISFFKSPSVVPAELYQGDQMLRLCIYKLCFPFCIFPPKDNLLFLYSCMAAHDGCLN